MEERKNANLAKKPDRLNASSPSLHNKIRLFGVVLEHPDVLPLVLHTGSVP